MAKNVWLGFSVAVCTVLAVKVFAQKQEISSLKSSGLDQRTLAACASGNKEDFSNGSAAVVRELSREEVVANLDKLLSMGKSVNELLEMKQQMDLSSAPAFVSKYFAYYAEWAYRTLPKDKSNDSWLRFAYKWLKLDPEQANDFYKSMAERDLTTRDFKTALLMSEIDKDYSLHMSDIFSSRTGADHEEKRKIVAHTIKLAYEDQGFALREQLLKLQKKTFDAESGGNTQALNEFYKHIWRDPKIDAISLTDKLFEDDSVTDNESYTLLSTGYEESRDKFLDWFKNDASDLINNKHISYVLMWYVSNVSEDDKKWLWESEKFRPFHNFAVKQTQADGGIVSVVSP